MIKKVRDGEKVLGTMIRVSRNPIITNIAKDAGFDFIMADMELGSYSLELMSDIFMSARALKLGIFVRVPELARGYVSRALDLGANGVMVPMIETVEHALKLVEWSKYTPIGNRGMTAIGGHTDYCKATDIREMMERLNQDTFTIAQIETGIGVRNVDDIAMVEGIDVLLVGPNDLSVSLGCPGEIGSEKVQNAIMKVAEACKKNGKILGIHGSVSLIERWIPFGLRFIMHSTDFDIMANGMKEIHNNCKKIID